MLFHPYPILESGASTLLLAYFKLNFVSSLLTRQEGGFLLQPADLSAFAGCSGIPLHLLKLIISPRAPSNIQGKNLQAFKNHSERTKHEL